MIIYTGPSGGIGRYMAAAAASAGERAVALRARMEDVPAINAELERLAPDDDVTLIHLAARVSVPACEADPGAALHVNAALAAATVERTCQWAHARKLPLRVVLVSTGHVYGPAPVGHRIREDDPIEPASAYARSKLAGELAVAEVGRRANVSVLVARVFGLIAPGQAQHYVLPSLIRRVADDELANVPGLDYTRDYLDVRDVCSGLLHLAACAWPHPVTTVNLCSGRPRTIRDLLRGILEVMDPAHAARRASVAGAAPGRPTDQAWLVGDPERFVRVTGRPPATIEFSRTIRDAVEGLS